MAAKLIKVVPVLCLSDNYAYLLIDESQKIAAAVDPVNADRVIAAAKKEGVTIKKILTTHHHSDHAGGNNAMVKSLPKLEVLGGDDRIQGITKKVTDGNKIMIGSITVTVFFTPCHTKGHVLYFCEQSGHTPCIFTGDTLFIGGCGKFFEGNGQQMHYALMEVIAKLDPTTSIWCGHEYTVANLRFAKSVDPDNKVLQEKFDWALAKRKNDEFTIPSTVKDELSFNPFMRVDKAEISKAVGAPDGDAVATMAALRETKNNFKG
eukprot:TRINITY_DN15995_c0_g1_i1.p1 TRINITY_DN15995_c0_g1~~TRINITY_DN15995_c0_g1_i1.p1  ORF type:complete len:290 (-),score=60.12 TRINITY_DN15995_c0_g1_i1:552-1340(-)